MYFYEIFIKFDENGNKMYMRKRNLSLSLLLSLSLSLSLRVPRPLVRGIIAHNPLLLIQTVPYFVADRFIIIETALTNTDQTKDHPVWKIIILTLVPL